MGDVVEVMLRQVMVALMTNDRALVNEVSRMDNTVDRLDEAIKLYVTKLTRGSLDEHEGRRATEIISFVIIWSMSAISSIKTCAKSLLRRSSTSFNSRMKGRLNSRRSISAFSKA